MFTAVRWLSRASCLKRFCDLLPEIKTFAEGKKDIPQLGDEVWVADLAFFVDITAHLSSLNRTLQGNNKLCHDLYSTATAFISFVFGKRSLQVVLQHIFQRYLTIEPMDHLKHTTDLSATLLMSSTAALTECILFCP